MLVALLLGACMIGVAVALIVGVGYMACGNESATHAELSNRLMSWRVGLQAAAIGLMALMASLA